MCGLFGVLNIPSSQLTQARAALHTLRHRGPDQWGEHLAAGCYLGHRRLSIRDLSPKGRQPFVDPATGVSVTVNGEVWNDQALRTELGESRFLSHSDCEIFLHGYLSWGLKGLLRRVDGFFAAAIHDPRRQRVYLVKDRWGKKPLYYARIGRQWAFASEVKALLHYEPQLRIFDYEGIKHWLAYRGSPHPGTIFHGVFRVPQGSYVVLETNGKIQCHRHFDLIAHTLAAAKTLSFRQTADDEAIEAYLQRAIAKRFLADVPVGLQLSGGVDSSLIALLARRHYGPGLKTFTITFPEHTAFSEAPYARQVAEHCGFQHHEIAVTGADIASQFSKLVHFFDGMLDIPNAIPLHILCREAKSHVSVLLAGEGADELFGGYGKFIRFGAGLQPRWWSAFIPEALFRLPGSAPFPDRWLHRLYIAKHYAGHPERLLDHLNCFISPLTLARYLGPLQAPLLSEADRRQLTSLPFITQLLAVDRLTYLNFLLERQDKSSMAAAIETRLPYLDYDLSEYVFRLPPSLLVADGHAKAPLKRLLARRLGQAFAERPKMGFALPIEHWLAPDYPLARHWERARRKDFLLWQRADRKALLAYMDNRHFDRRQLSYGDSERVWIRWFLSVLAAAQDIFQITDIR